MNTMKAAVFEGIENIKVREIPIPQVDNDNLLIKVESCGICGGDIRNFHAGLRHGVKRQVLGHEIAGIVVEKGSKVVGFKEGDRVALAPDVSCGTCYYCKKGLVNLCDNHRMLGTHWPGGFAQYVHLPSEILERGFIEKIPDGLSFDEACFAEPVCSVSACQENVNVSLGDSVVVFGDGPIGCVHVEIAKARGASKVILIGRRKLDLAKRFSPTHIINSNDSDPVEEVRRITGGLGADFCICANANAATQKQGVEMVRKRGTVVLFGGLPKNNCMTTLDSNLIHYNEIIVSGSFSYPKTQLKTALSLISEGIVSAARYITQKVPLDRIPEGIALHGEGRSLKAVVKPWVE